MGPDQALPHNAAFEDAEAYVSSLLHFVCTNDLLGILCGGVHILDFFTSEPDLYSQILPQDWRDFFARQDIMDILDLLMRKPLEDVRISEGDRWRDGPLPPKNLIDWISLVRKHLLDRRPSTTQCARNRAMKPTQKLARDVAVGMNVKKVHEVGLFASYINNLATEILTSTNHSISHLVDFGSGQNYLGRALASEPYNRSIVAIESKDSNAERAKEFDVTAKLATKEKILRNKKAFRAGVDAPQKVITPKELPTPPPEPATPANSIESSGVAVNGSIERPAGGKGTVQYVSHRIADGNLEDVTSRIPSPSSQLMTISLHSCGNLIHHGLRSLVLNPAVKAVAMVGCCYNLLTERLGPATYKHPELRPTASEHPRLEREGEACDPAGFPMSERLCQYNDGKGIRLNITARMMAVQAPQNWGERDSEGFFTRHFYRALLQKVFLDYGVVGPPRKEHEGASPAGHSSGTPIVIGSLRKGCYTDFVAYVRGAMAKLEQQPDIGDRIREKMGRLTDEAIAAYEGAYRHRKKELSVVWSLMAFSAGVIEATIVVDRWSWLSEQEAVKEAWVESVFDYGISPRNLVVVGVKRQSPEDSFEDRSTRCTANCLI